MIKAGHVSHTARPLAERFFAGTCIGPSCLSAVLGRRRGSGYGGLRQPLGVATAKPLGWKGSLSESAAGVAEPEACQSILASSLAVCNADGHGPRPGAVGGLMDRGLEQAARRD